MQKVLLGTKDLGQNKGYFLWESFKVLVGYNVTIIVISLLNLPDLIVSQCLS